MGKDNIIGGFAEKSVQFISDASFESFHPKKLRRVLTYGTYDLLHYGHIRLLQRAASLGDYLVVALSTDEFNAIKGKKSFYPYEVRREMLEAIRYVDLVIPENDWGQNVWMLRPMTLMLCAWAETGEAISDLRS